MAGIKTIKGVPGGLLVDGRPKILTEVYEGYKYDTVNCHNSGSAFASGQQFTFFRDLANKELSATNFTQQRRISRGEEFDIKTIGLHISPLNTTWHASTGFGDPIDFAWMVQNMYLNIRINKKDVSEGLAMFYPSGYGAVGSPNQAASNVCTNGVASPAAVRPLYKTISINSDHDVEGVLTHYTHVNWDTQYTSAAVAAAAGIHVKCILGGRVKSGITRG